MYIQSCQNLASVPIISRPALEDKKKWIKKHAAEIAFRRVFREEGLLAVFLLVALVVLLLVLALVLILILVALVLIIFTILHKDTSFRPMGHGSIVDEDLRNIHELISKFC